ncbi:MAG: ABC transporter permease [Hydrococcus sp. Prado102]|jgi:putative ABC transport system permease protein|nr:ABC transporter permease [Hydrococcus sp. Prado102]
MNLLENTNMAVKTLTANKLRSTLTMLGIIIGNASVIATIAIGQGAKQFTQQKLESFGPNQLTIFSDTSFRQGLSDETSEIVLSDVDAIATLAPAVRKVAPHTHISLDSQLLF